MKQVAFYAPYFLCRHCVRKASLSKRPLHERCYKDIYFGHRITVCVKPAFTDVKFPIYFLRKT